jgi:hypothetical protein
MRRQTGVEPVPRMYNGYHTSQMDVNLNPEIFI